MIEPQGKDLFPTPGMLPDVPAREQQVLEFWRAEKIFERTLEQTKHGAPYVFFEGPPTANGQPGVHHVLARAFKDLYPRFWTMRGRFVRRKAGWDTHGLPVEHQIEREIGIFDKSKLVAEVGIAEFNRRCRESVYRYVDDWNRMTVRMAYWVDLEHPYVTLDASYIESVWWLLKQLWDRGLIYQDYKSVPYDPRIGATLSDGEVALGYRETDDPSVYVRFRLKDDPSTSFLAWTTTPWTLPANMALAVHPDVVYAFVKTDSDAETYIVAEPLIPKVFGDASSSVVKRVKGSDLAGVRYLPLYEYCVSEKDRHYVIPAPFVTTEDGTGVVHVAPAYGPDDLALGKARDLPIYYSVDYTGHVVPEVTVAAGLFFKDADPPIIADLKKRGLMFRSGTIRHTYPFGWRTDDPLLYIAKTAWFIRTTQFKTQLLANNDQINWVPENIKQGRFGNWLENNIDWALSRERFWGTPLPLWTDGTDYICIGSVAELAQRAGRDVSSLDLHRPAIDEIAFTHEGREYRRVPEVIDAWFDSGSMPYAQWHYPFENAELFKASFPADFICEAVDQTRGWFYSLHAIGTMLNGLEPDRFAAPTYRNCVCLGHVVDERGEKMSKSKGNVIDPWEVFDSLGADALRWYFFASSPPGVAKRVSIELVREGTRKFFNTLWATVDFFTLYANADRVGIPAGVPLAQRPDMDRWAAARLAALTVDVTRALEVYDAQNASRAIETFVDDLSNWYVRLSRDRFWASGGSPDKTSAYRTLYECLCGVALLVAPFAPMLAESLYQLLVRALDRDAAESVHLVSWPAIESAKIDTSLIASMRAAQEAVDLGRQVRAAQRIKNRQPLPLAYVRPRSAADAAALERFRPLVLEELNVKDLQIVGLDAQFIEYALRPNLPRVGPRYGKQLGALRDALTAADARAVALAVAAGKKFTVNANGQSFELEPDDVLVDSKSASGYASAESNGMLVALDTRIDDALAKEGLAREAVREIQDARKRAALHISDRIEVTIHADAEYLAAIEEWRGYIAQQTLATRVEVGQGPGIQVSVRKVSA
jgi:isoleucyl-tRNA synthetase